MSDKFKVIEYKNGHSLEDLDLNSGEWVGFNNEDIDIPRPFIIARAKSRLVKLSDPFCNIQGMLALSQVTHPGQNFSLETGEEVIGLDGSSTSTNGFRLHYYIRDVKRYPVEYAYVGEENIIAGLEKIPNLGIYVGWLKGEFERLKNVR